MKKPIKWSLNRAQFKQNLQSQNLAGPLTAKIEIMVWGWGALVSLLHQDTVINVPYFQEEVARNVQNSHQEHMSFLEIQSVLADELVIEARAVLKQEYDLSLI